ncbi:ferrienterobactin receptor [Enterobacter cloacae]|uniref:Ferrienterobactin receptor n=1 Tax=Enterobacter cloacae TaxID=550 RepID=A0A377M3Y6_ENTCL|nr:ferrienterobactin receptor [Enterobacter cloacae]
MLHSEINLPIDFIVNQNLTLGTEWNQQRMKDSTSFSQTLQGRDHSRDERRSQPPIPPQRFSPCLRKTIWS